MIPASPTGDDMPPKSKAQARFMRAVAGGKVKKKGLSKVEAKEYVSGYSTKGLPEKKSKKSTRHKKGGSCSGGKRKK